MWGEEVTPEPTSGRAESTLAASPGQETVSSPPGASPLLPPQASPAPGGAGVQAGKDWVSPAPAAGEAHVVTLQNRTEGCEDTSEKGQAGGPRSSTPLPRGNVGQPAPTY